MQWSEQINEIAGAYAKAQAELRPAAKDSVNPAFRSKYADLASILEASRIYAKHGIAVLQEPTVNEVGASVVTVLMHSSGQWIRMDPMTIPVSKRDAHGVGSATTYAKRYSVSAALGIAADEDDDGNAAAQAPQSRPQAVPRPTDAPQTPPGFDNWLADLETVAADGLPALEAAWKKSQPFLRKHLLDTNGSKWEALKARAAKVPASA